MHHNMSPETVQRMHLVQRLLRRFLHRLYTIGSRDTEPTEFWIAVFTFGFLVASASAYGTPLATRPVWFAAMTDWFVGVPALVVFVPFGLFVVQLFSVLSGWRIVRAVVLSLSVAFYLLVGSWVHSSLTTSGVSFFVSCAFTLAAMCFWSAGRVWRPRIVLHDIDIRFDP